MANNDKGVYTLISATPSPYARKVRIVLAEKNIPFTLQTEVPWDSDTATPQYNPLEKLPVLINNETGKAVYESSFILEWLEIKHPNPPMIPAGEDDRLLAKQIEVVTDGMCDALVLSIWERNRDADKQSEPWAARQSRKVDGGLQALNTWVESRQSTYIIGDSLSLADIAICSVLGFMNVRFPDHAWKTKYPQLLAWWQEQETRESFKATQPKPQTYKDKIV